jgi:MFS family permease
MSSQSIVIPAAEARPDRRRWFALALVVAAQFMVVLDVAIVNVALPSIKTDLGFSQESLQWVITAYAILFGGTLLLGGRMSDLLGRRRLFMAGLVLFTAALARERAGVVGGLADHVPRHPGARRGAALAGGAVDPDDDVPGGTRAEPRARRLGRGLG